MTRDPAKDPLRFFFRSDNAPYALAKLPALRFHNGGLVKAAELDFFTIRKER